MTAVHIPLDIEIRLRHLDVMDRITQISIASNTMQDVLRGVLDLVLEVFNADRAWFLYPCDPEAPTWSVPMERTRPEWPGLHAQGVDMPMDSNISGVFSELLKANGAIQYGPDTDHLVPPLIAQLFSVKSQSMTSLRPKIGKDWVFGLHHCASAVKHDESELQLFTSIAFRIADILSGLLSIQQLRESEIRIQELADIAVQKSERHLKEAQSIAHIGSWDYNLATGQLVWSDELYRIYGVSPESFTTKVETLINLIHPDDQAAMKAWLEAGASGQRLVALEFRCVRPNGTIRNIEGQGEVFFDANGKPSHMSGTAQDISERKQIEEIVHERNEFFRMIAENIDDFIAVLDLEGRRIYNSPSYAKLFGDIETIKGTDSFAEIHPDDLEHIKQIFKETIQSGIGQRTEFRFVLADGSIRHMESLGGLIRDSQGQPSYVVIVSHDITKRKQTEEEIRKLAFYDSLTNLPNRHLLNDRLVQTLAICRRNGLYGALIFLDMDNFKPLNDKYGHGAGDLLLVEVARRINGCVREVDTVARFGGDEFVVVLSGLNVDKTESAKQATGVAEKICVALREPYLLKIWHDGKAEITIEHHCTSSIGAVLFIDHEANAEDILRRADMAMYQAKEAGRNQIKLFDV